MSVFWPLKGIVCRQFDAIVFGYGCFCDGYDSRTNRRYRFQYGIQSKTYNGSTSSGEENLSETVSFSAFTFAKATDQIVITVTVKNDFTESTSIDVHLAATVESDENQLIVIETSENLESGSDTIQSGASETYTITLSLSEKAQQQGVSQLTFSFDLSLSRTASSD